MTLKKDEENFCVYQSQSATGVGVATVIVTAKKIPHGFLSEYFVIIRPFKGKCVYDSSRYDIPDEVFNKAKTLLGNEEAGVVFPFGKQLAEGFLEHYLFESYKQLLGLPNPFILTKLDDVAGKTAFVQMWLRNQCTEEIKKILEQTENIKLKDFLTELKKVPPVVLKAFLE